MIFIWKLIAYRWDGCRKYINQIPLSITLVFTVGWSSMGLNINSIELYTTNLILCRYNYINFKNRSYIIDIEEYINPLLKYQADNA